MTKNDFAVNTKYVVTYKDSSGKLRPGNFYVYRLYDDYMIARNTDKSSLLHKLKYEDVVKIVKTIQVANYHQFKLPEVVLEEKNWKDRDVMHTYTSHPGLGK